MEEAIYKCKCDDCGSTGKQNHAKKFYKAYKGVFWYLCSLCWDAHNGTGGNVGKPQGFSFDRTVSEYNGGYES